MYPLMHIKLYACVDVYYCGYRISIVSMFLSFAPFLHTHCYAFV